MLASLRPTQASQVDYGLPLREWQAVSFRRVASQEEHSKT
jgi:hypothetical protein